MKIPRTTIYILLILVVNILIIRVILTTQDNTCSDCKIEFKSDMRDFLSDDEYVIEYKISELVEEYNKGECPVVWDKNNGFRLNG